MAASSGAHKLKVADAVWAATAMLHRAHPAREGFAVGEIVEKVEEERLTEGESISIYTHANQHCVANRPPNSARLRMLQEVGGNLRRLHRPNEPSHPARNGRFVPDPKEFPERLLPLFDWYPEWCKKRSARALLEDPLLALAGTGEGRWSTDAVAHVRRLRED